MADRVTSEQRSRNMRAIRSKDTAPELSVRRMLHRAGFRFRLHRTGLPGKPDIVLPRYRTVIFVHGCFWHGHGCSRGGAGAKTNSSYWAPKLERTKARDTFNRCKLVALGWRVYTVWECSVSDPMLMAKLEADIRAGYIER